MLAAKLSTLCTLLCLGLITADAITVYNGTYEFGDIKSITVHDSLMTVLACHESPEFGSIQKCNLSHTTVGSNGQLASCEVELDKNLYEIFVYPLSANKTILSYDTDNMADQEQYVTYSLVNFTDCTTSDILKISFKNIYISSNDFVTNFQPFLINENGSFEIITNDHNHCGKRICRYMFDAQGNKVEGPVKFFEPLGLAYKVLHKIPSSPNFVVWETDQSGQYRTSLIKSDGQVVLCAYAQHAVSTSHGFIRVCTKTKNNKIVDCELFDDNGKKLSKISVNTTQAVENLEVQNLANGDFLLKINGELNKKKTNTVMKIKADGSVIGVAEISRFECDSGGPYDHSNDYSNGQFCLIRAQGCGGKLMVQKECYEDSDFH